jgi:hypothetical protein
LFFFGGGAFFSRRDGHFDHSARDEVWDNVFWLNYNFANLILNLDFLLFEFLLLSDELFIGDLQASEFSQMSF